MNKKQLENKLRLFFYSPKSSSMKELDKQIGRMIGLNSKSSKKNDDDKKDED
ncbi:MAG: hypothetical protein FWD82_07195 [Defluviitaleaceae bacterium]|nr:hypothetical protein [Defluviitaleaceae bacterium]